MTNVSISSSSISAEIALFGAELQSLRDAQGRAYLHDGASFWAHRAPLLFPIVGELKDNRHLVNRAVFSLQRHGFARSSLFETVNVGPGCAQFKLMDSEETRAVYPYRFQLGVTYAVTGAEIRTQVSVTNMDNKPIPVAFGFHPAFKWPFPEAGDRADYAVDFALAESGPIMRLNADGLLASEAASPVKGNRLILADSLFEDDALIFLRPNSRSLRFGPAGGGTPALHITFEGMPQLGIWTKPGAPFLCIEPWHGYASPADFSGPLTEKPGSIALAPGETKEFGMSVAIEH